MSNANRRLHHLEKHAASLPTFPLDQLDDCGLILWLTDTTPAGRPPSVPADDTLARPYYLALPPAQRQYWRDQARQCLEYIVTHPKAVRDVFAEIAAEYPALSNP